MEKIPTIFERNREGNRGVIDKHVVSPVDLIGATATEKVDGTNVRVTIRNNIIVRVEKRRNPDKIQKAKGITEPWYIDADEFSPADKWIYDAVKNTSILNIEDGEWSAEAVGKNIQGNPLNLENNRLIFFSLPSVREQITFIGVPTMFEALKEWLPKQKSRVGIDSPIEGIVWWKDGQPIGKIKLKDFK